jgi:hypothetical protein
LCVVNIAIFAATKSRDVTTPVSQGWTEIGKTAGTYAIQWHEQTRGRYNLTVTLSSPPSGKASTKARVRYLDDVFNEVFVNFIGGVYNGFSLWIRVGNMTREFSDFGPFTPCRMVLALIDMGLKDVFTHRLVDIDLFDIH